MVKRFEIINLKFLENVLIFKKVEVSTFLFGTIMLK